MNKNVTKGLVVGALIAGYFVYRYFQQKNEALAESYNEQLSLLETSGSETAKKNEEFVELNEDCILIGDVKSFFNMLIGTDYFDTLEKYDAETRDNFKKILEGTTHFYNENEGLRKMFLYDLVRIGANIGDFDYPPRPLKYEYSSGLISLGDKGNDVRLLQELLNKIKTTAFQTKSADLMVNGTYDKATSQAVNEMFAGTSALIDAAKGSISKEFVNNLTTILNNLENF